jgi:hypothetical protein
LSQSQTALATRELTLPHAPTADAIEHSLKTYPHLPILLSLDLVFLMVWVSFVRPDFVRQASVSYAEALFRSLEK